MMTKIEDPSGYPAGYMTEYTISPLKIEPPSSVRNGLPEAAEQLKDWRKSLPLGMEWYVRSLYIFGGSNAWTAIKVASQTIWEVDCENKNWKLWEKDRQLTDLIGWGFPICCLVIVRCRTSLPFFLATTFSFFFSDPKIFLKPVLMLLANFWAIVFLAMTAAGAAVEANASVESNR